MVTTRHTIAPRHAISPSKVCADIAIVIALESKLKAQLPPKDVRCHLFHVHGCNFIALSMFGGKTANYSMEQAQQILILEYSCLFWGPFYV